MYYGFLMLLDALSPVLGSNPGAAADVANSAADVVAETPANPFGSIWIWVIYAVVIGGAFFLMSRPQRKREKQMKEMQASIKTGDNVVTSGGFYGRVADVGEDCFVVEFGTNRGIRIPVQKSDVIGIKAPKTTPMPKDVVETK